MLLETLCPHRLGPGLIWQGQIWEGLQGQVKGLLCWCGTHSDRHRWVVCKPLAVPGGEYIDKLSLESQVCHLSYMGGRGVCRDPRFKAHLGYRKSLRPVQGI